MPTTDALAELAPMSHAVFRVARLHKMMAGQLLRGIGLYPAQELVMMRLWTEGPQRHCDLVRMLDSEAPTMTRTIQRLEKTGLVRTSRSSADRGKHGSECTFFSRGVGANRKTVSSDTCSRRKAELLRRQPPSEYEDRL